MSDTKSNAQSNAMWGGRFADGKGESVWDMFCQHPEAVYDHHNGDTACDHYVNCANMDCNELFICCDSCLEKELGCCQDSCKSAARLRPYQEGLHKPFRRMSACG